MAKNTAIICEFNPLHNGHRAILSHVKEQGKTVIAIMSGNFTQRSECAVFDKYKRAEAAVRAGADTVLELPFPWCSAGAELFAHGAVSIAAGLGLRRFVFGSETGDASYVRRAAEVLETDEFESTLGEMLTGGVGAAAAYDSALKRLGFKLSSNDKLAAEYVRSAARLGIDAEFEAYLRMTDPDSYRSATDVRRMLYSGETSEKFMSKETLDVCGDKPDVRSGVLSEILFRYFRLLPAAPEGIFDAEGGVTERLMWAAGEALSAEEFFTLAATKKYTDSRLRRAALYTFLKVTKECVRRVPEFTVLLAANERGREFLSSVRKTKSIEVLTKPSVAEGLSDDGKEQYELWRRADELYSLCLARGVKRGEFLRRTPRII